MEFSSANFMEMSIQDVSDLLVNGITEDRKKVGALIYGRDQDGRKFKLSVVLEIDD